MDDLVVFVDEIKRFGDIRYFLHLLIDQWRQNGLTVQICAGINQLPAARIALMHIDATRIPSTYNVLSAHYQTVLNLRADDISKKRISCSLLSQHDHYTGPVIVKTDAKLRRRRRTFSTIQNAPPRTSSQIARQATPLDHDGHPLA